MCVIIQEAAKAAFDAKKNALNCSKIQKLNRSAIKRVRFLQKEFRKMKEDARLNTAHTRSKGWKDYISKYCQREQNIHIDKDTLWRKEIRLKALICVLDEQEDQQIMGIYDPVAIAASYVPTSNAAALIARDIGLQNELEVFETCDCLQESRKKCKRSKVFCLLIDKNLHNHESE
jgi:hypothetical protein